jgi:hypothetical protein
MASHEKLSKGQFSHLVPAYVEYPASAERGDDDEALVSRHELGTAQHLTTSGSTHIFRMHDGRQVSVNKEHYTPTERNSIEKYEEDPGWVSEKDEHDHVIDSIVDRFNE